jgi:hypothetical protein
MQRDELRRRDGKRSRKIKRRIKRIEKRLAKSRDEMEQRVEDLFTQVRHRACFIGIGEFLPCLQSSHTDWARRVGICNTTSLANRKEIDASGR